jgi:recombinational DNA repair protein RecR
MSIDPADYWMKKCNRCGNYKHSEGECHCELHKVEDEDGDMHEVYAVSEWQAALDYAEESNTSGDYYLMDDSVEIKVNGKPYRISAEPDVHYSADEISA